MIIRETLDHYAHLLAFWNKCRSEVDHSLRRMSNIDELMAPSSDGQINPLYQLISNEEAHKKQYFFDQLSLDTQNKLTNIRPKTSLQKEVRDNLYSLSRTESEYLYLRELDDLCQVFCAKLNTYWGSKPYYNYLDEKPPIKQWGQNYLIEYRTNASIQTAVTKVRIFYDSLLSTIQKDLSVVNNSLVYKSNIIEFNNITDIINFGKHSFLHRFDEKELINESQNNATEHNQKLKWNCSPAIAGYIISELIRAGYIEPPTTNGELSFAKLAGICNQIFDIQSKGKLTTLDYLKKVVNPESNTLPDPKRAKLRLPDLDQLT